MDRKSTLDRRHDVLRGMAMRRWARRAAFDRAPEERGPYALERLGSIDPSVAARFVPRLRPDVELVGGKLVLPDLELELEALETEILRRCDGVRSVHEIASELARTTGASGSLARALALLARVALYDVLVPGKQP